MIMMKMVIMIYDTSDDDIDTGDDGDDGGDDEPSHSSSRQLVHCCGTHQAHATHSRKAEVEKSSSKSLSKSTF